LIKARVKKTTKINKNTPASQKTKKVLEEQSEESERSEEEAPPLTFRGIHQKIPGGSVYPGEDPN